MLLIDDLSGRGVKAVAGEQEGRYNGSTVFCHSHDSFFGVVYLVQLPVFIDLHTLPQRRVLQCLQQNASPNEPGPKPILLFRIGDIESSQILPIGVVVGYMPDWFPDVGKANGIQNLDTAQSLDNFSKKLRENTNPLGCIESDTPAALSARWILSTMVTS